MVKLTSQEFYMATLRPTCFDEYIGQDRIKRSLQNSIDACQIEDKPFPHVLLHGSSGHGKTTLAYVISSEVDRRIYNLLAPTLTSIDQIYNSINDMKRNEILFIDEVHTLTATMQESLYTAMEDNVITVKDSIKVGRQTIHYAKEHKIKPFTCLVATTELGKLITPFRERFGYVLGLENYSEDHMKEIIKLNAEKEKITFTSEALRTLASRSRCVPRTANRLLERCRETAVVQNTNIITASMVKSTLALLGIDNLGLTDYDRKILHVLVTRYNGGPIGIKALSIASDIDEEAIQKVYEPLLIEKELLERTPRGRVVTAKGVMHLENL